MTVRRILAGFCILTAAAWVASLVVLAIDQVLTARRLGALDPLALAFMFLGIEIGCALFVQWRIRMASDWLSSPWTLGAVIAALCLSLMNVVAGMAVG